MKKSHRSTNRAETETKLLNDTKPANTFITYTAQ